MITEPNNTNRLLDWANKAQETADALIDEEFIIRKRDDHHKVLTTELIQSSLLSNHNTYTPGNECWSNGRAVQRLCFQLFLFLLFFFGCVCV